MITLPVAIGCVLAAAFAAWLWARPRDDAREIMARYPKSDLAWLFVPLSSVWRYRVQPADQPSLRELRGRVFAAAAATALAAAAALLALGPSATTPGGVEVVAPPPTGAEPAAGGALAESERPPQPVRLHATAHSDTEAPAPEPRPPEVPGEVPLADTRSRARLFGSAKVSAVYGRLSHDVHGVRVENLEPDSFWSIVGVRDGDVVIAYNGEPIDSPAAMVAMINAMQTDVVLRLRVRGVDDRERTVYYAVPRDE